MNNRSWDKVGAYIDAHIHWHLTVDENIKAIEWRNKACFQKSMRGQPYKTGKKYKFQPLTYIM